MSFQGWLLAKDARDAAGAGKFSARLAALDDASLPAGATRLGVL